MDEDEIREFVKKMDLKKGHYYIILTDVGDDKFKMHAYDTTGNKYENEMDHSVGSVIHEGLVGILPQHDSTQCNTRNSMRRRRQLV